MADQDREPENKKGLPFSKQDFVANLPRIILGLLSLFFGIICFTNHDIISQFILYVSVYLFGIFFFALGAFFIALGLYTLGGVWHKRKRIRRKPWLDIAIVALGAFSIGVLLSAGLQGAESLRTSNLSAFYSGQMSLLAPETATGNPFHIVIFGRLSNSGGGYIATLIVALGNILGITLVGTRVIFALMLVFALVVLARHPVLALVQTVNKIKIERMSAKVTAPAADLSIDYSVRKKADAEIVEAAKTASDGTVEAKPVNNAGSAVFVSEVKAAPAKRIEQPPWAEAEKTPERFTANDDDSFTKLTGPFDRAPEQNDEESHKTANMATERLIATHTLVGLTNRFAKDSINYDLRRPEAPGVVEVAITEQSPDSGDANTAYALPDVGLLQDYDNTEKKEQIKKIANATGLNIINFLSDYLINAHIDGYTIGASITRFKVRLEPGVKMSAIDNVLPNLRVALHGNTSVRFVPVIEGVNYSGIEVGNPVAMTVPFKDCYLQLQEEDRYGKKPTLIPLGQDVDGHTITLTLANMPHLLVAGSTGSGKSVFIHSLIMSLIMRSYPRDLKVLLIDPKKVEFSKYADMPHLYCPIVTDAQLAIEALHKMVDEMERRYSLLQMAGAVNIGEYKRWAKNHPEAENLPLIVVVIDEFADLMMTAKEAESYVARLAAKARACGIHLVVATQRPSTQVITGDIKNNIPVRIALMVSTQTDSRVILDDGGAENLLGRGDLLAKIPGKKACVRAQSPYVSDEEITAVVKYLKMHGRPSFNPAFLHFENPDEWADNSYGRAKTLAQVKTDALYAEVKKEILETGRASSSYISRRFGLSYNKASLFLDALENDGLIKSVSGGKRIVIGEDEGLVNR